MGRRGYPQHLLPVGTSGTVIAHSLAAKWLSPSPPVKSRLPAGWHATSPNFQAVRSLHQRLAHGIHYAVEYCASKHAVVGLTKAGAVEYAQQGISINAIAPGAIKTNILQTAIDAGSYSEESIAALHPMNRMGAPEDIANGIYYLASDASPFMTGSILSVDGGYNAK